MSDKLKAEWAAMPGYEKLLNVLVFVIYAAGAAAVWLIL